MDRVEYQTLVVQDIINLEKRGELNLSPWYQRRSIWNVSQKAYLVNTLLEQKPIPAIYIRHSIDLEEGRSVREVVDGQQRTRAILSYCSNDFAVLTPNHETKKKFSDLGKTLQQQFLLTAIPVGYLLGATDSDVIDIFGRINSISKSLNAQEKRNAKYSGDFKQFCLFQSSSRLSFWRDYGIFSTTDIARMNETQFISDLVVNLLGGLTDFSPTKIDKLYKQYDENFPDANEIGTRMDRIFDFLVSLNPQLFTETIFSRQPVFFSLLLVLDSMGSFNKKKIENALIEMDAIVCTEDQTQLSAAELEFIGAISSTTQRIAQRKIRHDFINTHIA